MRRAKSSLPDPVGPTRSTGISVGATREAASISLNNTGSRPTMGSAASMPAARSVSMPRMRSLSSPTWLSRCLSSSAHLRTSRQST